MADEQPNDSGLDEYTYSENDYDQAYPNVAETNALSRIKELFNKLLRQKRILIIIVVIATLYILIKVWSFFSHHDHSKKSTTFTVTKPAAQVQPQPIQVEQPQPVSTPHPQTIQALSELNANQRVLRQQTTETLQGVSQNVNAMRDSIVQLTNSMNRLEGALYQQLQYQRQQTAQRMSAFRRQAMQRYQLDAVIPGRAWLIGPQQTILTVQVGSRIPAVGIVTQIDPRNGVVYTNTGVEIRFPYSP